ncbi:MAG: bifunctional 3,4-dihydroxy-2-butanone-4-phosphate synthase/GTP cyclohydrolase II [Deltaproteobacteria bacterium]|nr:bifunctional 3,4-dihydroxy-2-butanone-4-phosphate synthase/GTP cyclohydrolase II [Deltaproteobacteria bacterium]
MCSGNGTADATAAQGGTKGLARIEDALEDIRAGRMVILVDDEDRENEGDLTIAADHVTPEIVNFMARYGRGLICLTVTEERARRLRLPPMAGENSSPFGTAFTVSIEAKSGVTTGISAADRATTIRAATAPDAKADDLVRPGHVFPIVAREGGVLVRTGQTEGSVDLARLAGCSPAGVICEIMKEDGTMARMPDLREFSERHGLRIVSIKDLVAYRVRREKLVSLVGEARLPVRSAGEFEVIAFRSDIDGQTHLALVKGKVRSDAPTLVRVHSECLTGDVFGSLRCDCGEQLEDALARIHAEGEGVLLYMRQEGRGIGLGNKILAYELQDRGLDTIEANEKLGFLPDMRDYGTGAQILKELGIRDIRLMTNNPRKIVGLEGYGLRIVERLPIDVGPNPVNAGYLSTKRRKLGHLLAETAAVGSRNTCGT